VTPDPLSSRTGSRPTRSRSVAPHRPIVSLTAASSTRRYAVSRPSNGPRSCITPSTTTASPPRDGRPAGGTYRGGIIEQGLRHRARSPRTNREGRASWRRATTPRAGTRRRRRRPRRRGPRRRRRPPRPRRRKADSRDQVMGLPPAPRVTPTATGGPDGRSDFHPPLVVVQRRAGSPLTEECPGERQRP
jgi:hypothetical protein